MFEQLEGYEDLELSTQVLIEEALERGYEVDVIDRQNNFISIKNEDKIEYIKQATKTSLDNYASIMVMENKYVTNKILRESGFSVPDSVKIDRKYTFDILKEVLKNSKIVVKPLSTNFGIGISILDEGYTHEQVKQSIDIALKEDDSVLVEEFAVGKEYRFLIIDNEIVGILNRVAAHVIGDGKSTIEELVALKNQSPLRGENYNKPLQKIKIGIIEENVLKQQGHSKGSIPKKDEYVNLRENSNVSNGGEPIDYTDDVHITYKEIALNAAKKLNLKVTGLDMIIRDISQQADKSNHAIIELNFNPALHIHKYPAKGKSRNGAVNLLNALFN